MAGLGPGIEAEAGALGADAAKEDFAERLKSRLAINASLANFVSKPVDKHQY